MRVWDRHVKSPNAARRHRYTPAALHNVPCLPNAPSARLCGSEAQDARLMRARSNMRSRVALPGGAGMRSLLRIEHSACPAAQACADMLERCGVSSMPLSQRVCQSNRMQGEAGAKHGMPGSCACGATCAVAWLCPAARECSPPLRTAFPACQPPPSNRTRPTTARFPQGGFGLPSRTRLALPLHTSSAERPRSSSALTSRPPQRTSRPLALAYSLPERSICASAPGPASEYIAAP